MLRLMNSRPVSFDRVVVKHFFRTNRRAKLVFMLLVLKLPLFIGQLALSGVSDAGWADHIQSIQ